jgi:hypothetical protein
MARKFPWDTDMFPRICLWPTSWSILHVLFFKIYLHIIVPSMPGSPLQLSKQNFEQVCHRSHARHMPSHLTLLNLTPNNMLWNFSNYALISSLFLPIPNNIRNCFFYILILKFLDTRCIIVVQTHCISLYTYLLTNVLILRIERTWKTKTHMGFWNVS